MIGRILRKLLSADIMALVLMLTALEALTIGISSSLRNTDTRYFFWICLAAALVSCVLNRLRFNGIQTSVAMAALGIIGVWILGARLTRPLLDLGNAILDVAPLVVSGLRSHNPVDITPVVETWRAVSDASNALSQRIQVWLMGLNRNVTVNDPLVRNMTWTLIMWLNASWIGWFAGRRSAVPALLPSILLLAAVTSYSEYRVEMLWLMVFILLLLLGVWNYKNHTTLWETKRVDYSDSIRYDVSQAVVFLTIIIGILAFATPSISWRDVRDFIRDWNKPSENEVADVLGVQQQQVAGSSTPRQKPALPRDHLLSGGFALSQDIVMTIRTGELPPVVNPSLTANPPRHYWRSTTYDTYLGSGWVSSPAPAQTYAANTPLIPGLLNGYRILHLDVEMVEPEGKLFWSGILFSTDVPFTANWRYRPRSDLFANQSTLLQADMFAALSKARAYKADAYIPDVTIEELRLASIEYPEQIVKGYLQLPGSLPDRVARLAKQITAGRTNPYDKAKAIESYLRSNYPYTLDVPVPPSNQDVADYFLFDLKKGYCDYYATAMVVLARASGIPARFVSGYASGVYDAANAEYVVQELHAHSWVEIYFPEIGWIEFEPTASQPEIVLAESAPVLPNVDQPDSTAARLLNQFRLERAIYWITPLAVIIFAAIIYFVLIERWWYLHFAPAIAIEKMYRRLYRWGRPLTGARTRAETIHEFEQKLIARLDRLKEHSRFVKSLSGAQHDVGLLTDLYQEALFSHNNVQKSDARTALRTWKQLRRRIFMAKLSAFLHKVLNRPASQ